MNISVSQSSIIKDDTKYKSPRKSLNRQKINKDTQYVELKGNNCQNKTSYIKQLINMENPLTMNKKSPINNQTIKNQPQKQKTYILNSKFITNKNNFLISQKVPQNSNKILHQSCNKSTLQSQSHLNSFCTSSSKMADILTSRSPAFIDKHLTTKKQESNQFTQSYKKFDITKLDFSSGFIKPSKQTLCVTLPSDSQYSSLVSKSRSNIKKIIQLNRMLKENKICQNEKQQKTEIQKFTDDIRFIQKIRTGCFGTVFKAKILSIGKFVAIKSFPYDRKFHQREEQICKLINNPFVVKVHKIFHTTDIESKNKPKIIQNKNEMPFKSLEQKRVIFSSKKSIKRIQKQPENSRFQSQMSDFPSQLHKISDNKSTPLKDHIKQFHNITNIVMDLYDCDLNDYIMMKNKTDNLTLKLYCYQMLRSVLYLHSNYICHRDIKPNNFLVKKHLIVLGDFGSAKIMKNNKNSNVSYICSRYYRAPQLILGYKFYDKSIDIWSLGTVMAELALGKPLFTGANTLDQLVRIIKIIGEPDWRKISFMIDKIPKLPEVQPKGLKHLFSSEISPLFVDLLQNMLKFNPLQRITAGQALSHPFFDEIRDQINFQQICKQMDIHNFLTFNRDQLKQNQHLKNKLIPYWIAQNQKFQGSKTNNFLR